MDRKLFHHRLQLFNNMKLRRELSRSFFRIDEGVINRNFKDPAAGGNHFYLHRQFCFYFGRQTGGPWPIASGIAIFNADVHAVLLDVFAKSILLRWLSKKRQMLCSRHYPLSEQVAGRVKLIVARILGRFAQQIGDLFLAGGRNFFQ